jgi:hypothetical protein
LYRHSTSPVFAFSARTWLFGVGDEHHAVVDDGRRLVDAAFAGRDVPHPAQLADVRGRDLVERL